MNLELLVVFLDVPALVIPGHLNFGPRRMFPKMFLAKLRIQWRIQKLFLQLKKKKIQLKKKETEVAPPEDPEVVPPAPRDEPKISSSTRRVVFSSRGSRSFSSCSKYRRRIHKMILLPETSKSSHPRSKIKDPGQV